MAPRIEYTDISTEGLVDPNSRYSNRQIIYWGEKRVMTFTTYKKHASPFADGDRFWVISKAFEYRPYNVAHRIYGDVNLWWKLLEANGMKDIMEFQAGKTIRIPSVLN